MGSLRLLILLVPSRLDLPASLRSCFKKSTHNSGNTALYTNPKLLNTLRKLYSPMFKKTNKEGLQPHGSMVKNYLKMVTEKMRKTNNSVGVI